MSKVIYSLLTITYFHLLAHVNFTRDDDLFKMDL